VGTRLRKAFAILASAATNATIRYVGGVLLLLVLGAIGVWVTQTHLKANTTPRVLLQAFSEAALVSSVLAILVDPYLKRRLQSDSGWGALFGYLNPTAPKELREAIQELAACKRYYTKASWTVSFSWYDQEKTILAITLEVVRTGYNIGPEPYRPNGRPWVLASTHGYQTEYLRYALSCPGHITTIDCAGADLQSYVVVQSDGSVYLEESRLVQGRAVPPKALFESINRTRMYRHAAGYIPLHYENFFERLTFTLSGPALNDLYVRVQHPRQDKKNLPAEWKRLSTDTDMPAVKTFGRATPGQVTLVSWGLASESPHRSQTQI
jgi:hypothetical protein